MILRNTSKLRLITGQAADVDVDISFADLPDGTDVVSADFQVTNGIVTATTTDILAAPAAGVRRKFKGCFIRNKHASASVDLTILREIATVPTQWHKFTLKAQEAMEYVEGVGFNLLANTTPGDLVKALSADDAGGQNVATAQPWFPTQGAVAVTGDTSYRFTGLLCTTRAAGAVSHTIGQLFGGTASLTSIQYQADTATGDVDATTAVQRTIARVATNTTVKGASTGATEAVSIRLEGFVRINAAGTFIPQFIYSAAPGGTPTIKANSYFRMEKYGNGSFVSQGVWS